MMKKILIILLSVTCLMMAGCGEKDISLDCTAEKSVSEAESSIVAAKETEQPAEEVQKLEEPLKETEVSNEKDSGEGDLKEVTVPAKAIQFTNAVINEEYDAHVIELGTTYNFNSKRISSSTQSASTDVICYYIGDTTKATVDATEGIVTPLETGYTTLTVCCGATANEAKAVTNTVK